MLIEMTRSASAAAILRRLMRLPVLGLARWRRFAKAMASARSSPCGSRPSHFPSSLALARSRVTQFGDSDGWPDPCSKKSRSIAQEVSEPSYEQPHEVLRTTHEPGPRCPRPNSAAGVGFDR